MDGIVKIEDPLHKFAFMLLERVENLEGDVISLRKEKDDLEKKIALTRLEDTYNCKFAYERSDLFRFGSVLSLKEEADFNIADKLSMFFNMDLKQNHNIKKVETEITKFISIDNVQCFEILDIAIRFNEDIGKHTRQFIVEQFDKMISNAIGSDPNVILTRYQLILPSIWETYDFIEYQKTSLIL